MGLLTGSVFPKSRFGTFIWNKISLPPSPFRYVPKNNVSSGLQSNSAPSDITIYSYESKNLYRMMSVFGIIQSVFWLNLASLVTVPAKPASNDSIMLEFQQKHKYKIAIGSGLLGGAVMFFTIMFPLRSISKISLLRSSNAVNISTYSFFGKQRAFSTSLDNISCDLSRTCKGAYLSMKIKGKPFYFLMDKSSGIFHEPKLFDQVVGLKRILN